MTIKKFSLLFFLIVLLSGCVAVQEKKDYTLFRQANPRSILVVPVVNRSVDVNAPDYFLSTISYPVAERGYYVFPINLVKRILEDDGLSDADMVHQADPTRLAGLFGSDAVLYIAIERWDAKYMVLNTIVTVEFSYALKSGIDGETLWNASEKIVYNPNQGNNSLAAMLINAALTKAMPNYMPLAQQANRTAVIKPHSGLPAGPHLETHGKDLEDF